MRQLLVVVPVLLAALGCSSNRHHASRDAQSRAPSRAWVSLPWLADELDLDYRGEEGGYIELSAPPDNVVLVHDSRRALVNGRTVSMERPCQLRGAEYVVSSADADRVTRALLEIRAGRGSPPVAERAPSRAASAPPILRAAWRPSAPSRPWKYIVIHHMASERGCADAIHRIHQSQGFDGLGYHFVIGNGSQSGDGVVEVGYRWKTQTHGAHARVHPGDDNYWNRFGIGICLVGDFTRSDPSREQMDALVDLVTELMEAYRIPARNVVPHRFVKPTECPGPNFPWGEFQARLR
jgi:hypothetical protein